jgi:hypothetical protein
MWVDVGIVVGWRLGLAQRVGGVARAAYIPRDADVDWVESCHMLRMNIVL